MHANYGGAREVQVEKLQECNRSRLATGGAFARVCAPGRVGWCSWVAPGHMHGAGHMLETPMGPRWTDAARGVTLTAIGACTAARYGKEPSPTRRIHASGTKSWYYAARTRRRRGARRGAARRGEATRWRTVRVRGTDGVTKVEKEYRKAKMKMRENANVRRTARTP